jgi:hypothetical protein
MIGVLLLLAAGVFAAWLFDSFFIAKRKPMVKIEGVSLIQALKGNEQYESIRQGQAVPHPRSDNRPLHHGGRVEQIGDGGNGGDVLRLDSRR